MDNSQILTIALAAVPNMLAVLAGILINNSRGSATWGAIWTSVSTKCATYGGPSFNRVEQVIDARLKHLE